MEQMNTACFRSLCVSLLHEHSETCQTLGQYCKWHLRSYTERKSAEALLQNNMKMKEQWHNKKQGQD